MSTIMEELKPEVKEKHEFHKREESIIKHLGVSGRWGCQDARARIEIDKKITDNFCSRTKFSDEILIEGIKRIFNSGKIFRMTGKIKNISNFQIPWTTNNWMRGQKWKLFQWNFTFQVLVFRQ